MSAWSWDQRIERAAELEKTWPAVREVLRFYGELATFQKELFTRLKSDRTLKDDPDLGLLLPEFASLICLVLRVGPPRLAEAVAELSEGVLMAYWRGEPQDEAEAFIGRALLQPYAERLAQSAQIPRKSAQPACPLCDRQPQVGVLRPEGYGARRSLLCSLCSTEWDFPRITCPACGESTFEKLSVYTAAEFDHVRVEACDTCQHYIKTVDLTKNGLAVPVVDELAAIPLDLWAEERGYRKLQPNLLGM